MPRYVNRRVFLQVGGALAVGAGVAPCSFAAKAGGAPHAEEIGWRLACNAYCFRNLTFYETIGKVSSLGLKRVVGFNWQELDRGYGAATFGEKMSEADCREAKKRLADAGVELVACYCKNWGEKQSCRRLFDLAKGLDIETLVGEPLPEALDRVEKLCDEYKINVAIHNHAKPSPYWRPETILKLLQNRSRRIGACCDTGHWTRSGLNPVATLTKMLDRAIIFDLKDVDERGACVPFGTGKGDIHGILMLLRQRRFRGVLGIEYDQCPPDIEKQISQCITFLDNSAKEPQQ